VPTFELRNSDGDDAGTFRTVAPDWRVGDIFRTGDGRRLRITAIPLEPTAQFVDRSTSGVWEVEPA